MRSRKEIDDLFGDQRFEGQFIRQPWASTSDHTGRHLSLVIVVYPPNDVLFYQIESADEVIQVYHKFADAIKAFREMV